jgi:GT2 family glycosyltransferase
VNCNPVGLKSGKLDVDVVVVTVLWRQRAGLTSYLHKQRTRPLAGVNIRCIEVFNEVQVGASPGESVAELVDEALLHVWSGGNLGYAGGNNLGIECGSRIWSPRYWLILNPDVLIDIDAIEKLIATADSDPTAAVVGPLQQLHQGAATKIRRGMRYFSLFSILTPVYKANSRIDYLNGGALLLRASAFDGDVQLPDWSFLFFEEIEICDRVRRSGYAVRVCEGSCVIHQEAGSRGSRCDDDYIPEVAEYFENINALRFTRKNYPRRIVPVFLVRSILKPMVLLARGDVIRLRFWFLALKDFIFFRVSRFPFQLGWNPNLVNEKLVDVPWPRFAKFKNKSLV